MIHTKITGKKKAFVVVGFLMLFGGFLLSFNSLTPSGNAVLSVSTTYVPNSTLEGNVLLSLKSGEFIPNNTIVRISMENSSYEYFLYELVENEQVEGEYFIENSNINGSGNGYGIEGSEKIYPEVDFTIRIVDKINEVNSVGGGTGDVEESVNDEASSGDTVSEEVSNESESNTTESESGSEVEELPAGGESIEESSEGNINDEIQEGESVETPEVEVSESVSEEVSEEVSESEVSNEESISEDSGSVEESSENEEGFSAPITGNVVASIGEEINGKVSKNNPFLYELQQGKTAELVSSSQEVELRIENGGVIITTNYFEEVGSGFGVGFLGGESYMLEIDLNSLNLPVEKGVLEIGFFYGDLEIISVSTELTIEDPNKNVTTKVVTYNDEKIKDFALSDEELFLIKGKTGSEKAEIVKAVESGGRVIIRFKIGNFWAENSYDLDLKKEELDYAIELDRAKFLKRLAINLVKGERGEVEIEGYLGNNNLLQQDDLESNESEVVEAQIEENENNDNESLNEEGFNGSSEEINVSQNNS